jgi:hypothetical protein
LRRQGLPPLQQGIAPDGRNDQHGQDPKVATRTALIVCIRFSA